MNRLAVGKLVVVAIAVAWFFLVLVSYYIVHKPFGIDNLLAMLNALGDVLVAGAIFLLAMLVGRRVLRGFNFSSPLQALVLPTGLGLGLVSLATFGLGVVGALNALLFWALLLAILFLLRKDLAQLRRDLGAIHFPILTRLDRALLVFCGFALTLAFFSALAPPLAWDAQVYHLVIPQTAIAQGRITAPPDLLYFSFPSLLEMLYLAAMLLKGDIVPQLIHFGFLLLTLVALFDFALRHFSSRVAVFACAIVCAVPSLVMLASWAYVDLALMFYATVAFIVLIDARQTNAWQGYALSGAFAGLAMGIKYTAAIIPVALFILLLAHKESRQPRLIIGHWSFAILFAAPWYLRNLVFMGNPFYPFVFGGAYWDSFRAEWFSRFGTGLANAPFQLLIAPWDATINGVDGTVSYDATIGPLVLLFIPLLVLAFFNRTEKSARSPLARDALIFSAILYLFWLVGIAESKLLLQTRLLFPAFPILALLAAVGFDRLRDLDLPQFSLHRFATLLVALVIALTSMNYWLAWVGDNPLTYLTGAQSREAYLANHLGDYGAAIRFINTQLPSNARVLFWWEPRSYYAQRATQPEADLDAFAHLRYLYHDADTMASALRQQGYTHILLANGGLDYVLQQSSDPMGAEDISVLQTFAARYLRQVYGTAPLEIVTRAGKPSVRNAAADSYAVYEWSR